MKTLGFSLKEIDKMDIGFMYDILITKAKNDKSAHEAMDNGGKKKNKVRNATQFDFDRF